MRAGIAAACLGFGVSLWIGFALRAALWWHMDVDGYGDGSLFWQLALPVPLAVTGIILAMKEDEDG
jgi:hypothetical protein